MDLATFPEPQTAARGAQRAGAPVAEPMSGRTSAAEEEGGRRGRQGIYRRFLESSGAAADGAAGGEPSIHSEAADVHGVGSCGSRDVDRRASPCVSPTASGINRAC